MESLSRDERKKIVQDELFLLKEDQYISSHTYQDVLKAHQKFYDDLAAREKLIEKIPETQTKPLTPKLQQQPKKLKPVVPKQIKIKTEEQIRERNITWLLNLGVILLLIGGLYVATSNWATMSNLTKAGSIGLISILFYGIAYVSKRVLRINKTAFAFIVLGSLFLPIFLLSIGWFQLIGTYLSIFGEGRYIFGVISSILVLPVYIFLAKRLSSRLFVWFSYLTFIIAAGFLLRAVHLEEDSFYLGMMLLQGILIFLYHRNKRKEEFKLFTKEFVYFAQLNLILTTVLMLSLYHSHAYLGFNLMLTAVIYLAMIYVTGKKEFHFVFSAMLVYGAYQFIEFSLLADFSSLLLAGIGFVFLAVPKALDDEYPWKRIFSITSGVVSGLAFLLITFEAILIRWGEPSFVLFLAYIAIAGNFLYLTNTTKQLLFRYLTAVFISVAFFEGLLLLNNAIEFRPFIIFVSLIGFTMFAGLEILVKRSWFELVKQPARDVGWAYMLISFYAAVSMYAWWETGVILLIISFSAYISLTKETRTSYKPVGEWLVPISIGLSVFFFGEEWRQLSNFYLNELGVAIHFILASIILLVVYFMLKNNQLKRTHFYVSEAFYTLGLLATTVFPMNEEWLRPIVFLGGIAMYLWLYKYTKVKGFAYLVSSITLMTYFAFLVPIGELGNLQQLIIGAVLLFIVGFTVRGKDNMLFKAYGYVGHLYMPFALLFTLFIYEKESIWSFLAALAIYGASTRLVEKEWKRKVFLYSAFTALFVVFATGIAHVDNVNGEFAYLLTSIAITAFWAYADLSYKKRTIFYLVPFSLMGIIAFLSMYPYDFLPFIVTILYSIGLLVLLHLSRWEFLTAIPTLLIYMATLQYLMVHPFAAENELITLAGFGIVFLLAGKWFYPRLYEQLVFKIDFYTIGALVFFATMYAFEQPALWLKILPGILIVLSIWLQRNRIPSEIRWIPTFVAGAYILQPYYTLLGELQIHYLLESEVYVLPLVVLGIYLKLCLKGNFDKIVNQLQWAILLIVAAVLVIDGLKTSTIYDALILGSLSLASLLAGVFLKIKSYFFIGSGVLLLNVFMQTRPFWGNLPWWAYLLIAGSILIGVASSNEWNKQKATRGERTIISTWKTKFLSMWKKWD